MAQQTMNSLCTAIKVFVRKGELNEKKSDEFFIQAGIRLRWLKERLKRSDGPWDAYVKTHCNLSQTWADELIRRAKGHDATKKARANNAARNKKVRAKTKASKENPASRDAGNGHANGYQDPSKIDTCDFDPTDMRKLQGEPYSVTRKRGFLASCKVAIEHAERNLFVRDNKANWAKLDPSEITDEVIEAAQHAADAWLEVVATLRRWRTNNGNRTKAANQAALH